MTHYGIEYSIKGIGNSAFLKIVQNIQHSLYAEGSFTGIFRVRHAVRIYKDSISRLEGYIRIRVFNVRTKSHHQTMFILIKLILPILPHDHRILVSGVCHPEPAGMYIKNAKPGRNKKMCIIPLTQLFIGIMQYLRGFSSRHCPIPYHGLCYHHKKSRRHPLAGYVSYDHGKMPFIYEKIIIEISSYLPCGGHDRIYIKFMSVGKCRIICWKDILLYPACYAKLSFFSF